MKANHNEVTIEADYEFGAFNISKIQDESKSQLINTNNNSTKRCFQYFKDTR